MGFFTKPEVVILKETSDAQEYLTRLEGLLPKAQGDIKAKIQKEISLTKAGIAGEDKILFELRNSGMDLVVLHDIYIETRDGKGAQIDFIVITAKQIFLIECKNLFGNIKINERGDFIRKIQNGKYWVEEGIYSPVTQNERHLTVLRECISEDKGWLKMLAIKMNFDSIYKSLVVLANPKTVLDDRYAKKEVKEKVIRADQLVSTIKKAMLETKDFPSSLREMTETGKRLLMRNREDRKDYFTKYEDLVKEIENVPDQKVEKIKSAESAKTVNDPVLRCPKCGSELVLRTAKKGANAGNLFYGCSSFPKCRFIRNVGKPEKEQ